MISLTVPLCMGEEGLGGEVFRARRAGRSHAAPSLFKAAHGGGRAKPAEPACKWVSAIGTACRKSRHGLARLCMTRQRSMESCGGRAPKREHGLLLHIPSFLAQNLSKRIGGMGGETWKKLSCERSTP